jgi:ParB-like chromosome segregation protein Spo0J
MKLGKKKKKKQVDETELESSPVVTPMNATYPEVDIDLLVPNTWNPNVLDKDGMKKLKVNIQDTLDAAGTIPPVVVRPHPKQDGKFEIIDGYHRTEVMKKLDKQKVPVCIMHIDTKRAMRLTETLNHLRGTNDPEKYVTYLEEMINEHGESLESMSEYLPDTVEDMETLMRAHQVKLDDVAISGDGLEDEDEDEDQKAEDTWVDVKFRVSQPMAEIIEAEIARISSVLDGGNVRGRALEFMAINSSEVPLESVGGVDADGDSRKTSFLKKKLKSKGSKKRREKEPPVELGED